MIDICQSRRLAERQLWSGYVRTLFQTLEIDSRAAAPDITESVAVFCQRQPQIPGHSLSLLMARSFCITGDEEAAGRILRHDRAHRSHAESWLEVLSAGYPFPELYPLFSSRALRPQRLTSAGTVWVVDFDKIRLTEADRHELILFQTVRVLIEKVSTVWKKPNGSGALGINGLSRLTNFVRFRGVSRQLPGHIRDVLALCAQKNGWTNTPAVLFFNH
jgi:hypothetical protein